MKNSLPVIKHEDHRRTLIEWIQDFTVRSCKIVVAHNGFEIGNHYHKEKDEIFYLFKGIGSVELDGEKEMFKEGDIVYVPKGCRHTFNLKEGSILLGAATKPFNENDEIR